MRLYFANDYKTAAADLMQLYGIKSESRKDKAGGYFEIAIPEFWGPLRTQTFLASLERFDSRILGGDSLRSQLPGKFFPKF
jgi:hypothetical protein